MELLNKLHKELFDCIDFMAKTEDTQESTTIPKDGKLQPQQLL